MTGAGGIRILDENSPAARLSLLAPLANAPFPLDGSVGDFFADNDPGTGERIRVIAGNRYGEADHYRENTAFLHLPPGFVPDRPYRILLYFHGHETDARKAADTDQEVTHQLARSGANAVLIAPQLALRAQDSHAGNLTLEGRAKALIGEACAVLSDHIGGGIDAAAPVVIMSFSGGYRAVAACARRGGLGNQIAGLVLLDSLYDQLEDFAHWRRARPDGFFVALNGASTRGNAANLAAALQEKGIAITDRLPEKLRGGETVFIATEKPHTAIPLEGPPAHPVSEILRRLP